MSKQEKRGGCIKDPLARKRETPGVDWECNETVWLEHKAKKREERNRKNLKSQFRGVPTKGGKPSKRGGG